MDIINNIAKEEDLYESFIHEHAIKLFEFIKYDYDDHDYIAKLCYYLISTLDPTYLEENVYNLLPNYNKNLSMSENNTLRNESILRVVNTTIDVLKLCSGNLINPSKDLDLIIKNDLIFNDKNIIGSGTYGKVYLIDGFAVKIASYEDLDMEFNFLIKETVALSMLGRIRFIGFNQNEKHYYLGMDYYPTPFVKNGILQTSNYGIAMREIAKELLLIHSFGIIHGDIKFENIAIDKDNNFKIIDFGSCMFTPLVESELGFFGTIAFKDYFLLDNKNETIGYQSDIWALGIIFYTMETGNPPWEISENDKEQKSLIEKNWENSMRDVSDLVRGMLSLSKEDRWSLERIICVTEYVTYEISIINKTLLY